MKLLFLLLLIPCCLKAQQRAYSPAGNYLESGDTARFKVYYLGSDTLINPQAMRKEMSDSCGANQQKAIVLMRKKGCMQRQACRDSIFYYQGRASVFLDMESKFKVPDRPIPAAMLDVFVGHVEVHNNLIPIIDLTIKP